MADKKESEETGTLRRTLMPSCVVGYFDPAMAMKTRDVQHHDAPKQAL